MTSRPFSLFTNHLLPTLTFFIFALPSHPTSAPILNATLPLLIPLIDLPTAGRSIECFNLTTPKAHPVDLTDCPHAIDLLFHDPTGVMTLQKFSRNHHLTSTFLVPHAWQIGACQVLLTSGGDLAVDTFRLVDVIVKATRIIEECPPKSKKSLGGIALVGNGATFFVAVNGPDLSPDGEGEGGGGVVLGGDWDDDDDEDGAADDADSDLTSRGRLITS